MYIHINTHTHVLPYIHACMYVARYVCKCVRIYNMYTHATR